MPHHCEVTGRKASILGNNGSHFRPFGNSVRAAIKGTDMIGFAGLC